MTVSSMSFPTFAVDEADQKQDFEELIADSELIAEGTDELQKTDLELRQQIDEQIEIVLTATGAKPEMTDEEITNAVIYMDADEYDAVYAAFDAIEALAAQMTEEQLAAYSEDEGAQTVGRVNSTLEALNTPMLLTTVEVLDGKVSITDSANSCSESNGTVTITAKGSTFSTKTNTITITNEASKIATISFDYTVTGISTAWYSGDKFSFDGKSGNGTWSYSGVLASGESVTMTLAEQGGSTAKVVMSNFSIELAPDTLNVTVDYDSTFGSVTANGSAVNPGSIVEGVTLADGVALKATPVSGAVFLGWINESTHEILSKDAECTLKPTGDMTVRAVFAKTSPWFLVNGNRLYEGLPEAMDAVANVANKTVVLANNATLPADNYIIPSGITLLIPRDDSGTVNESTPERIGSNTYSSNKPTVFRTLTMGSGASITVYGKLCVNAMQSADQAYAGHVTGPYGCINMSSGSTITLKSGSTLYAWGYIQGSGSVVADDGSTVYEDFQLTDFRGGQGTMEMADNANRVFPMSQYYIQNIEVPLTINAGASVRGSMAIDITGVGIQGADIPVIGNSGAMFKINSGYIVKDYLEGTGRLNFTIAGNVDITPISMSMKLGMLGGDTTLDSSKYNLPISGHMTVTAVSGHININQDVVLFPGAELYVRKDVTCKISYGKKIIVYDLDEWGTYCRHNNVRWVALPFVPGGGGTTGREKDALVQIDGFVDASEGAVYTTEGGANVCSTGTGRVITKCGTDPVTYQVIEQTNTTFSATIKYTEIKITPAKLKNADGTYLETSKIDAASTNGYQYMNGKWVCYKATDACIGHTEVVDAAVAPTCTDTGLTERKHCSVCNEVLVAQTVVAALGHTPGAAATCTTAQTCTACGTELKAALGHTEVVDAAVAPTCTATGKTEGKHCSVCNEVLVAQTVVDALGHKPGAAATCTTAQTCTVCNTELVKALGHTPGAAATCTTAQTCTVCNTELVKALGHTPGAAATCTTAQICTVCNTELKAALGHIDENPKDHICDRDGCKASMGTCADGNDTDHLCDYGCGKTLTEHVFSLDTTKGVDGYEWVDNGKSCTAHGKCACGETTTATATITSKQTKDPTCTEKGDTTYTAAFDVDWAVEQTKVVTDVAETNHKWNVGYEWTENTDGKWICTATRVCENDTGHHATATATKITSKQTKDPTCTEAGDTTYTATFNIVWAETQTKVVTDVNAKNHAWSVEYNFAADGSTCTATRVCGNDANHNVTATATITRAVANAATCTEPGDTKYTATFTEDWAENQYKTVKGDIPAINHDWKDPTYNFAANGKACTATRVCGNDASHVETAEAAEITSVLSKAPTCTEKGDTTYTATFTEDWAEDQTKVVTDVAALNHAWSVEYNFAADGSACTATRVCGNDAEHNVTVEATITSTVANAATCVKPGDTTYTATFTTVGNWAEPQYKTVEGDISVKPHSEMIKAAVAPTCTETGLTKGTYCGSCGKVLVAQETVAALGHTEAREA